MFAAVGCKVQAQATFWLLSAPHAGQRAGPSGSSQTGPISINSSNWPRGTMPLRQIAGAALHTHRSAQETGGHVHLAWHCCVKGRWEVGEADWQHAARLPRTATTELLTLGTGLAVVIV